MYDKFGEFNSAEELNRAAAAQRDEGDEEALVLLAEENGIDKEDAEDYMDGVIDELVTPLSAALGKLRVEERHLSLGGILKDWVDEIREFCMNNSELCIAVKKKDKPLAGYIAKLAEDGFKNKTDIHKDIIDRAPEIKKFLNGHPFSIGVPNKATRLALMQQYYLE
jgi:hypothetical protein